MREVEEQVLGSERGLLSIDGNLIEQQRKAQIPC